MDQFKGEINHIKVTRDEQFAHTSKNNKPTQLHARGQGNRLYIKHAMNLLDRFVDGEIPYVLRYSETESYDLREMINTE